MTASDPGARRRDHYIINAVLPDDFSTDPCTGFTSAGWEDSGGAAGRRSSATPGRSPSGRPCVRPPARAAFTPLPPISTSCRMPGTHPRPCRLPAPPRPCLPDAAQPLHATFPAPDVALLPPCHVASRALHAASSAPTPPAALATRKSRDFAEGLPISHPNLGTLLKVFWHRQSRAFFSKLCTLGFRNASGPSTQRSRRNLQQSAEVCQAPTQTFSKVPRFAKRQPSIQRRQPFRRPRGNRMRWRSSRRRRKTAVRLCARMPSRVVITFNIASNFSRSASWS